ncbi:hypothetical protein BpHYR1_040573 [Brachionus plicatilis]|uniref:Uncharacterized protein n=1 Tax=Brachionus plicatilis TaxID=10195 RepID=A0A3M7RH18_BRAPC|nr:hypothetical protein BpHYR1_040573 [Brachionus plicatilis]
MNREPCWSMENSTKWLMMSRSCKCGCRFVRKSSSSRLRFEPSCCGCCCCWLCWLCWCLEASCRRALRPLGALGVFIVLLGVKVAVELLLEFELSRE